MFFVRGGHYTDFTFTVVEAGLEEEYGPFETYQAAASTWKAQMWLKVDDGQHRLSIVEEPVDMIDNS